MEKSVFNLDHQNSNMESKIVASLERVSQAFKVLLWNESKDFSLSPIQIQILIFLSNHTVEKRKVTYLADEFNMTKATISEAIKTLEQKELIKKEIELKDTRSYTIHLTEKGNEIAQKTSFFANQIKIPIENLKVEEKENLLLSLLNIIQHLNQTGIITIQRMCTTCQYYKPNTNNQEHFCSLMNKELMNSELRIDCPEHKLKVIS
jgi:DNA-binding MarR family transcriptional regulator